MSSQPKLLIVEDYPGQRERLLEITRKPTPEWGISVSFASMAAGDAASALALLREADAAGDPFEVVLLDLGIPETDGGLSYAQIGLRLLGSIREEFSAAAVVVITKDEENAHIVESLRRGVVDFINRSAIDPDMEKQIVFRLIKAAGAAREDWYSRLKQSRTLRHLAIARQMGRDELAQAVTRGVQEISNDLGRIRSTLFERYALDDQSDADDSLVLEFAQARRDADSLLQTIWERGDVAPGADEPRLDVTAATREEATRMRLCFLGKSITFEIDVAPSLFTKTLEADFRDLLVELLFGILESNPRRARLSAVYTSDGKDIEIKVAYDGPTVATRAVERLAKGSEPKADSQLDKSYFHLSCLSGNLGVRLDSGRDGNLAFVKLLLPVI